MKKTPYARQKGFSLVELMVAATIGLVILGGVVVAFLTNRDSTRFNEEMMKLQENGRAVMSFLTEDLRMAGYAGCMRTSFDDKDFLPDDANIGVSPALTWLGGINAKKNVRRGFDWTKGSKLELYGVPGSAWLYVNKECAAEIKETEPSDFDNPGGNSIAAYPYGRHLYSYDAAEKTLYLQEDGNDAVPLLGPGSEIKEYDGQVRVEGFAVCGGMDEKMDGTITKWRKDPPANDDDYNQITALRVDLLLSSEMDVLDQAASPSFTLCDDTTISPAATKKLYKLFTVSGTLRNKVPNGCGEEARKLNPSGRVGALCAS
ncbi:MAG: PilW family protein [Zoogloeaceae bacterium]|jgi:type IV pilus assembly protein PilW|nr:PilW family protein [Zoogloeaceae bacterium]